MLIAERGENNRYVTEAMKGWFTSIRCSTDMVLYNIIIDTFMYYVVIYTHMYYARRLRAPLYMCIFMYICICIYTYTFMFIAEWSVVRDIGEAKLHPFLLFSVRFKRPQTSLE